MLTKSALIGQFVAAADKRSETLESRGCDGPIYGHGSAFSQECRRHWRANCKARKVANSGWSVVCSDAG
jgi:hypothetical protein